MPKKKTKYTIYFKEKGGSHHSTKTMSEEDYQLFLLDVITYFVDLKRIPNIPTRFFEVEKRTIIFSTLDK